MRLISSVWVIKIEGRQFDRRKMKNGIDMKTLLRPSLLEIVVQ